MEKKLLILLVIILTVCLFSGCTQQNTWSNNNTNDTDSENNGGSNNDTDLYDKISIISGSETLKQNEGIGGFFDIDEECKFVVINWEVIAPTELTIDEQQNIIFELMQPPNNISVEYTYDIIKNRNLRFNISSSNCGKWSYGFLNGITLSNVTINREIYILR